MTNIEIKGSLARLLATENLVVEHKQVPTASFDVANRVLTLPMWTRASDTVYNLLVGHEVGHALYTPNSPDFDKLPCPMAFLNVTEDARIEKLMKRKYPGLSKDFYGGYSELHSQDFFMVEDKNLEELPLIDRINLHFKIGAYAMMPFNAAETPLKDAVAVAETFEEAIAAADAIWKYTQDNQPENTEEEDDLESEGFGATPFDQGQEDQEDFGPLEDLSTGKGGEDSPNPQHMPDFDSPESKEEQGENGEGDNMHSLGPNEALGYARPSIDVVETQRSFDAQASQLADENQREISYASFPKKIDHDNIIVSPQKIWDAAEKEWQEWVIAGYEEKGQPSPFNEVDAKFVSFCKRTAKDVNYLVKEFECKKAASAYARQSIAKTGVLDTAKLHTYKFNDDIFKKVTRTPDGKNHGLVFLLDWSGSMACEIYETICQVINLCQFCKKVGIPFDVYSFVVDGGMSLIAEGKEYNDSYYEDDGSTLFTSSRNVGEFFIDKRFRLGNLLSSDTHTKVFNKHCKNLYRVANYYAQRNHWESSAPRPPKFMGLGGTPLNEALVVMQSYLGKWKATKNVEKTHLIVLTDGESQCLPTCKQGVSGGWRDLGEGTIYPDYNQYNTVIRHKGRHYATVHNANSEMTQRLLEVIRETNPGSNVLGIRICPSRGFRYFLSHLGIHDYNKATSIHKKFKKNKCAVVQNVGYNELYVLASNSYNEDTEMDVKEDATKAEIKRAFGKSLKSKSINRAMLSSFVGQIA